VSVEVDLTAALLGAVAGGVTVAVVLLRRTRSRLRALASVVESWHGASVLAPLPAPAPGSDDAELVVALNALVASYRRRGEAIARERPWRTQLVDALTEPALLFSPEGRMLAANEAARQLTGLALSTTDASVAQALGSTSLAEAVRQVRSDGTPLTLDVKRDGKDLRATVSLVGDETLLLVADRTRERQVEDVRRNFVVNASHELKTPVTAIQALAEALDLTIRDDPERSAALAKRLVAESERLARLVNDLLDLRRLEERGPLERVPVDVAEVVRLAVADVIPRAEARQVSMAVEAPEAARIAGVPADVEAIVKNLVSNAVKYNRDGGSVLVSVRTVDGSQVVTVADTGIGIPQQDHVRIFERFYRVDTARSRATGGTGLGLSIVRNAVERHGGQVRVESLLGEGTTFTVTLPIAQDS
jgi:signal transduction histidine kinase